MVNQPVPVSFIVPVPIPAVAPVVFINCDIFPFIDQIISGEKVFETRNKNTLGRFVGQWVYLAETRKGRPPVVKCIVFIDDCMDCRLEKIWDILRSETMVPVGSKYDWTNETRVKWLYSIADAVPVSPFIPSGRRHGRVWMEME